MGTGLPVLAASTYPASSGNHFDEPYLCSSKGPQTAVERRVEVWVIIPHSIIHTTLYKSLIPPNPQKTKISTVRHADTSAAQHNTIKDSLGCPSLKYIYFPLVVSKTPPFFSPSDTTGEECPSARSSVRQDATTWLPYQDGGMGACLKSPGVVSLSSRWRARERWPGGVSSVVSKQLDSPPQVPHPHASRTEYSNQFCRHLVQS